MPLAKQKVQLSIVDGLDTKTDDKNVVATSFSELENCVFTQTGSLSKRNGYQILTNKTVDDKTINNGLGLATFKEELLQFDGKKLYSYVSGADRWVDKGSVVSLVSKVDPVVNNSFEQVNAEYGVVNNIEVYAWEDSRGGVRYSVIDLNTQNFITSDQEIHSSGSDPKIIKLGGSLLVLYRVGATLSYRKINPATANVLGPVVQVANTLAPSAAYDVAIGGQRVFLAWHANFGGIGLKFIDSNFDQSSTTNIIGETVSDTINVYCDCADNVFVYYSTGTSLKYLAYNYDITISTVAPTLIETISNIKHITAIETDAAAQKQTVLYEIELATNNNFIKKAVTDIAGNVDAPTVFMRSVGLYSKIFKTANDFYVVTSFSSDLQSTYFTFSLDGDLISRSVAQNAGGYKVGPNLTEVYEVSTEVFKFAAIKKHTLISDNGVLFSLKGVQGVTLDFKSNNHYLNEDLADNLHIVGGMLQMYDGNRLVEHGFSVFPEGVQVSLGGGGSLQAGSYQYVAVYAWTDNFGQLHRSAPSVPVTVTAALNQAATVTIPTLRVTKKDNAFIEVYGTTVNGDLFYKLTTVAAPLFNDKTIDAVTFTDTQTDTQKLDNELLYTTGGVLDNIAPESSSLITFYKNRIFLGQLDSNTIAYSKQHILGRPVEFNDALTIEVDERGGKTTSLANLDNFLVIFKERAIYVLSGEGPNNLGEQNDFGIPQLVTSDAGCSDSNSVIEVPDGLMFKSTKGIYLLDRSLKVSYIGDKVEKFNNQEITSAALLADTNQVRFTTESSVALVYDYYHRRWSTFTNHEALDADVFDGSYAFVKANGEVFLEAVGSFQDGAQPIPAKIVSSWIQAAGIQGFQRFYRLMLLGNYKSEHDLRVRFAFDFNPAYVEDSLIKATDIIAPTAYGDDSPYGDGSPYGGDGQAYQWEVNPKRQKCQAFRFKIEDSMNENFGESFSLSNMAMIIGVKVGLNKKNDAFGIASS